jgi:hypothetical protein
MNFPFLTETYISDEEESPELTIQSLTTLKNIKSPSYIRFLAYGGLVNSNVMPSKWRIKMA